MRCLLGHRKRRCVLAVMPDRNCSVTEYAGDRTLGQYVSFDGVGELLLALSGWQREVYIQRIHPEMVMMRSMGRAGAAVPDIAEIVGALRGMTKPHGRCRRAFRNVVGACGNVISEPVRKRHWRVGVVHDNGDTFCSCRQCGPLDIGRYIGAVTGESGWYGLAIFEV